MPQFVTDLADSTKTLEIFHISWGVLVKSYAEFIPADYKTDATSAISRPNADRINDDVFALDVSGNELEKYGCLYILYREADSSEYKIALYAHTEEMNLLDTARNVLYLDLSSQIINCTLNWEYVQPIARHYHTSFLDADAESEDKLENTYKSQVALDLIKATLLTSSPNLRVGATYDVGDFLIHDSNLRKVTTEYTTDGTNDSVNSSKAFDRKTLSDLGGAPNSSSSVKVEYRSLGSILEIKPNIALLETDEAMSQQLTIDNGVASGNWTVSSGSLPDGISLSTAGVLSGTPTVEDTFTFTIQVVGVSNLGNEDEPYSFTLTKDYSLEVSDEVTNLLLDDGSDGGILLLSGSDRLQLNNV